MKDIRDLIIELLKDGHRVSDIVQYCNEAGVKVARHQVTYEKTKLKVDELRKQQIIDTITDYLNDAKEPVSEVSEVSKLETVQEQDEQQLQEKAFNQYLAMNGEMNNKTSRDVCFYLKMGETFTNIAKEHQSKFLTALLVDRKKTKEELQSFQSRVVFGS